MTSRRPLLVLTAILLTMSLVATGVVLLLNLGSGIERPRAQPLDLGPVIARVNGSPIHLGEAAARVEGLTTVHGQVSDALGEDWPEVILQSLVDDQLLIQQASDLKIQVSDADIQAYVERVRSMVGEGTTFDSWLEEQHMTLPELERRAELQLIGARVYITVTDDVTVSGSEIRDYYREHRAEFEEADGTIPPLLEVRRDLREGMLKERQDESYAAWLADVRKDAEVVVVVDGWWKDI